MTRTGLSPPSRQPCHRAFRLGPSVGCRPVRPLRRRVGAARPIIMGRARFRVVVTPSQERGAVFVPMHWNDETASDARTGSLVHSIVDPISGQPDSKATPVAIEPVVMRSAGFILSRSRVHLPRDSYWAWSAIKDGYVARIDTAGDGGGSAGDTPRGLRAGCRHPALRGSRTRHRPRGAAGRRQARRRDVPGAERQGTEMVRSCPMPGRPRRSTSRCVE